MIDEEIIDQLSEKVEPGQWLYENDFTDCVHDIREIRWLNNTIKHDCSKTGFEKEMFRKKLSSLENKLMESFKLFTKPDSGFLKKLWYDELPLELRPKHISNNEQDNLDKLANLLYETETNESSESSESSDNFDSHDYLKM